MAKIVINEISQNYSYNIGNNSFAGVALPITACWGPAYQCYKKAGYESKCQMREHSAFYRFPATKEGLESFVATFRGPAANYRLAKDYSYQMAMTLLTAGYDVLACRVAPGDAAKGTFTTGTTEYEVLAAEPEDWATNYSAYFTKTTEAGVDIYSPVEGVDSYSEAIPAGTEVPSNWRLRKYKDYYTINAAGEYVTNNISDWDDALAQDGGLHTYTGLVAPTFAANTYYKVKAGDTQKVLKIAAKYPGTFGNNLRVRLVKSSRTYKNRETGENYYYWNLITYIVDNAGVQTSAENRIFVFELDNVTDNIPHISEITSDFLDIDASGVATVKDDANTVFQPGEGADPATNSDDDIRLVGGTDRTNLTDWDINEIMVDGKDAGTEDAMPSVYDLANARFNPTLTTDYGHQYLAAIEKRSAKLAEEGDKANAEMYYYREWCYSAAHDVLDLLKDKLSYNMQAIILPGWDDQNIADMQGYEMGEPMEDLSPLHIKMMEVAYYSRCACAHIDIPRSCLRKYVYVDEGVNGEECDGVDKNIVGYAQMLARIIPNNADYDVNTALYTTHSALFAPWRKYTYVGMGRQTDAPPSFLALMIHRAQLLNQPLQYFWALPTNRTQNLKIGRAQYATPGKILNTWQQIEGVGINVITEIPDVGTTIWGNSTLFEVPPATYQALANLSTRYLVNAVEDISYRCGIAITFQYNNNQAYNKFYAGVTPTLDTMKNVGAIDDYYIEMAADINGLEQVNANTVIGKIYLVINGVINDIVVDLIALPPGVDLDQYRS